VLRISKPKEELQIASANLDAVRRGAGGGLEQFCAASFKEPTCELCQEVVADGTQAAQEDGALRQQNLLDDPDSGEPRTRVEMAKCTQDPTCWFGGPWYDCRGCFVGQELCGGSGSQPLADVDKAVKTKSLSFSGRPSQTTTFAACL
jgi:hypothetical protein